DAKNEWHFLAAFAAFAFQAGVGSADTLLIVLDPVTGILFEVGQRFERPHAIEEEHAVQVIGFMLDHARRKVLRTQFDAIAPAVQRADPDFACTRNAPADVGNAQAAFPVLHYLAADHRNLRVDDGNRFGRLVIV